MNLSLLNYTTDKYKSASQKIRVVSEGWFLDNGYCAECLSNLSPLPNNQPVADFLCISCKEQYELKSKCGKFSNKIVDGEYNTMIKRINSNDNPNLYALSYENNFVKNIIAVPKFFFTESVIEKRKPLSDTAQRAGWTGCNILFSEIPEIGKIYLVKDGKEREKKLVNNEWKLSKNFEIKNPKSRGWTFEILKIVDKQTKEFKIEDIYKYKNVLISKFPENKHIEDKIRQQLQIIRDKNYIKFLGKGNYIKV